MPSRTVTLLAIALFGVLNAIINVLYVRATHRHAVQRPPPYGHYTFIDEDYPPHMLLSTAPKARRYVPEDSARYAIWAPEAADEWLWTATEGDGNARLGHNARLFVVAAAHQLHCLRSYRDALEQETPPADAHQVGHITHCLNFMRMHVMCAADDTLEPPDALVRNHTLERAGAERECVDSTAFYGDMKANWEDWLEYKRAYGEGQESARGGAYHDGHAHR